MIEVTTNNVPRDVLDSWDLNGEERQEFDYIDWRAIERGEDSATFARYKQNVYDLNDVERSTIPGWDGMVTETFFSGVVLRYVDDCEHVIFGRYVCR